MGRTKGIENMKERFEGKIFYCEDYVNTDVMAPGRFDPIYEDSKLAKIALIDYKGLEPFVDPATRRSKFQIIVAGQDFGCGSSRETAPMALSAAGVNIVIAKSFARIFFRNCVNLGQIYPLEVDHNFNESVHGLEAEIDFGQNKLQIGDVSHQFKDLGILKPIFDSGGLSSFVAKNGGLNCL